ncbi:MAG: BIG2 domain-containing protein [Lachnoclostridium sp.]|jgi:serine protease Do
MGSVFNMKRVKKIMLGFIMAFVLTSAIPVTMPLSNSVVTADAATVKLNLTSSSIYVGDSLQLKIIGTKKSVRWTSSNTKVAKVSSKGLVTGLKKGTVTITATVGSKKYLSTVKVKKKELTAEEVYEKCSKATVEILAELSGNRYNLGSGFFIDKGIVVTNFHVVTSATSIKITDSEKKTYKVEQVLGYDEKIDLALLKINSQNEYLEKSDEEVKAGETVYTLGSPLGLTGTIASGMVSSPIRTIENVKYIQVTAPMSPGNSGGPLLNKYGEVMGINTWQYTEGQNLNFSIDISEIQNVKTDNPLSMSEFTQETLGKKVIAPSFYKSVTDTLDTSKTCYGLLKLTNTAGYALVLFR